MFITSTNRTIKSEWAEYAKTNFADFNSNQVNRLIDGFNQLDDINIDQISLLLQILGSIVKLENIPLKKFQVLIRDNKAFLLEIVKVDQKLKNLLTLYSQLLDAHKSEVKTLFGWNVIKRLESVNIKSQLVPQIARKIYEYGKSNGSLSPAVEIPVALYLLTKNLLKIEDAKQIYDKSKTTTEDIALRSKLLAYILRKTPISDYSKDDIVAEVNDKLEVLHKSLNDTNARHVLSTLSLILAFPPQFLSGQKDLYVKALKEFTSFGNHQTYLGIILSLPADKVRNNFEFYNHILKELINNYTNYNKRLSPSDIIKILKKFSDCNSRSSTMYNYILADLGRVFNFLKPEDHAEIVTSFSRIGIKQSDLFDKIVAKIVAHLNQYYNSLPQIFAAFFKIGYDTQ